MTLKRKAIQAIEKHHILLTFPIQNRKEPMSLWHVLHPRSQMRWEWDDGGDSRVADLWHLREELSSSGKVVYLKWYQGRATFFSKTAYKYFLNEIRELPGYHAGISSDAHRILKALQNTSPLSTKQLKAETNMQGKLMEGIFQRALKSLWERLLIVGYGEIDDGAFPSLAIGAAELMHEGLWKEALRAPTAASPAFEKALKVMPQFAQFQQKIKTKLSRQPERLIISGRVLSS